MQQCFQCLCFQKSTTLKCVGKITVLIERGEKQGSVSKEYKPRDPGSSLNAPLRGQDKQKTWGGKTKIACFEDR